MSTPTLTNPVTPTKPKPKKSRDKDRDRDRKEKTLLPGERLKIVVRRLPPNLPEDIFWQSVSNWVTDETITWKIYFPGKPRKRVNKENIPSRAYIVFKTPEQLSIFGREYDGHKFVDKAGNESYAIVEYAPYQKIPGEKKKPDSRHATIEKDEDYISFIESLKAPPNVESVSIETLIASARPASPPKTTPLLEALKAEKQAQKDKEAIIQNHPHYKLNPPAPGAFRKEEKRKAARAEASGPPAGKKGKKAAAAPPPPPKQIQIQTKPSTSGGSAHNVNIATPTPAKPQPSPSRAGRAAKHAAKVVKEANAAAASANATTTQAPVSKDVRAPSTHRAPDATPTVPLQVQDITTTATVPPVQPKRARPVLGLGSRHFEAALSGAGMTGERKRREKGKETLSTPAAPAAVPQDGNVQERPPPSTSPKRPRHRKEGHAGVVSGGPDVNGAGVIAVSLPAQVDGGGAPPHINGGRGGRRGGRGGPGRGRGPPRVG
ncbi:hypothetical protein P691DRAFT_801340 [Macrolepiota fuliginosa MF-IS2]|uniref:UPF3 domain-containing protein n=1 Tax=Macrolepiota fuliginosa MF-IS2 TaxID=1400762 RepID=A0A9P5XB15_9AGAR|nr:hypothetical protein P691DRAFT_801340 [Macrolepiota fuliginosa MF-IS2]